MIKDSTIILQEFNEIVKDIEMSEQLNLSRTVEENVVILTNGTELIFKPFLILHQILHAVY